MTIHSEDQAWIGAFNFRLMGFKKPPAFKYLRSWWQRSADLRATDENRADSCPIKYALNYMRDFYREYEDTLSFSYVSTSALSHNEPEKIQMFDDGFVDFFRDMKKSGQLNSTIVIFFGDHGMREGQFRQTAQGQMEERLPFMSLTFPPRFYEENQRKIRNLKRNSHVITTPYDMHITLKHLLNLTTEPEKHVYGRSLFSNIVKENRTCASAGIPHNWCVCTELIPVSITDPIVKNVANQMVKTINTMLESNSESRNECSELRLTKIARASISDRPWDDDKVDYTTYEVVFQVSPSGGLFEGVAEYHKQSQKIKVSESFSRINKYGTQPKCIARKLPFLRKYCYCKS